MKEKDIDIWIAPDGSIRYMEVPGLNLATMGQKESRRLSRIEKDEAAQRWKVFDHATNEFLGDFASREDALEFEYGYFRQLLDETYQTRTR